eukprot:g25151.t1
MKTAQLNPIERTHAATRISAGYGFQQRYKSEALHAHLLCSCHHPPPAEQAACDLGQHVWIQEKLADDLAMVVGFQGDELLLRGHKPADSLGGYVSLCSKWLVDL